MADLVTCTALGANVLHVRRINTQYPVRLGGHTRPLPQALCGADVDRDTELPVERQRIGCQWCRGTL